MQGYTADEVRPAELAGIKTALEMVYPKSQVTVKGVTDVAIGTRRELHAAGHTLSTGPWVQSTRQHPNRRLAADTAITVDYVVVTPDTTLMDTFVGTAERLAQGKVIN